MKKLKVGKVSLVALAALLAAGLVGLVLVEPSGSIGGGSDSDLFSDVESKESERLSTQGRTRSSSMDKKWLETIPATLEEASPQIQLEAFVNKVSFEARERLSQYKREARMEIDPAEHQLFIEKMRSISDPEERRTMMMAQRESDLARMRAFEESLTQEQIAERNRLEKISRLAGMLGSARRFAWSDDLRSSIGRLEEDLHQFASNYSELDQGDFADRWTELETVHRELLRKGMELRNLASSRNQPK